MIIISWSKEVPFTLGITLPSIELRSLVSRGELKIRLKPLQKFPRKNKFFVEKLRDLLTVAFSKTNDSL